MTRVPHDYAAERAEEDRKRQKNTVLISEHFPFLSRKGLVCSCEAEFHSVGGAISIETQWAQHLAVVQASAAAHDHTESFSQAWNALRPVFEAQESNTRTGIPAGEIATENMDRIIAEIRNGSHRAQWIPAAPVEPVITFSPAAVDAWVVLSDAHSAHRFSEPKRVFGWFHESGADGVWPAIMHGQRLASAERALAEYDHPIMEFFAQKFDAVNASMELERRSKERAVHDRARAEREK